MHSQESFKSSQKKARELRSGWLPVKGDRTTLSVNGGRATAKLTISIIRSPVAGSTPITRVPITIIGILPGSRTLAGRLTNSYELAVCLLIRLATLEIRTRSSIHVPLITFLPSGG